MFGADLGYTSIYNQQQDTRLYFKSVKNLLDDLKVDVDYEFFNNENLQTDLSKDSLVSLITNTFYETYHFFNERSEPELAVLMAAGVWIEGVYIATHVTEETFNNTNMVSLVFKQKTL
ncbi:MAG: hypothetical protein HC896_02870 [Bacteroidales bacterium]|nr:hypothetical protein [Bacteroidales bacterium]